MRNRRFQDLQRRTEAIESQALDLEAKNRTDEEKEFFIVHGYWPEAAQVGERMESTFTTHGLRTTIILERTRATEGSGKKENGHATD